MALSFEVKMCTATHRLDVPPFLWCCWLLLSALAFHCTLVTIPRLLFLLRNHFQARSLCFWAIPSPPYVNNYNTSYNCIVGWFSFGCYFFFSQMASGLCCWILFYYLYSSIYQDWYRLTRFEKKLYKKKQKKYAELVAWNSGCDPNNSLILYLEKKCLPYNKLECSLMFYFVLITCNMLFCIVCCGTSTVA